MADQSNFWGKYKPDNEPKLHFDPLQTFEQDDFIYGFRIHVVPGRSNRPRDHKLPSAVLEEDQETEEDKKSSVLYQITVGSELCVPIATDREIVGKPTDEPVKMDFTNFKGVAIMNKFSPLGITSKEATGVALVIYPTEYIESLNQWKRNYELLVPLKTAVVSLVEENLYRDDLNAALTFFNIGPSSGASLKQLHAQTYVMKKATGLLTYAFNKSFQSVSWCLACRMARGNKITDHLGQTINMEALTIWEDQFVRLIVPYAALRPMAVRVIVKDHISYIGEASTDILKSIAKALQIGHQIIILATLPGWPLKKDRTVAFRQAEEVGKDFHMFIDILPSLPLGGAEVIDSLSITSLQPYRLAKRMRRICNEKIHLST